MTLDNSFTHVDMGKFGKAFYHYIFLIITFVGYCLIESVHFCCEHGILMDALPANVTHIFQSLDVAVFKPFKTIIREPLQLQMFEMADPALDNVV